MSGFEDAVGASNLDDAVACVTAQLGPNVTVWRTIDGERELLGGEPDADHPHTASVTGLCQATFEVATDADPRLAACTAALLSEVSDRIEIGDRARRARRRLADSERIGATGTYSWSLETDELDWSDGLTRLYGHTPGDFAPSYESFLEQVHPEDRDRVRTLRERSLRTGEPFDLEERIVRPDGEVRTLWSLGEVTTDDDGRPTGIVGVCRDVTEQREAEQRVADADLRRRQALELNDNVIQGLVSLLWQLGDDADEDVRRIAETTLTASRRMVTDLLQGADDPDTGKLVRQSRVDLDDAPADPDAIDLDVLDVDTVGAATASARSTEPDAADTPAHLVPIEPPADPPADGTSARAITVVVADDLPTLRMLLRLRLTGIDGVEVLAEACDGQQAVDLAVRLRPDIVVMDLSMPVLDGLQATRRIRASAPGTRVVVLSGYPGATMEADALAAGAERYIEKSGDLTELFEAVTSLVHSGDLGP